MLHFSLPAHVVRGILVPGAFSLAIFALTLVTATAARADDQPSGRAAIAAPDETAEPAPAALALTASPSPSPSSPPIIAVVTADEPAAPPDDLAPAVPDDEPDVDGDAELVPAHVPVIVHRHVCASNVDAIAGDVALLSDACPEPFVPQGVISTLLISADGVTHPALGDGDGVHEWPEIVLGDHLMGTETPAGFSPEPVVYCRVDVGNSDWVRYPTASSAFSFALNVEGAPFLCLWYEVPLPTGAIAVTKWVCPAGYDLTAPGADPEVDCPIIFDGVAFTVSSDLGLWQPVVTGSDGPGRFALTALAPATYQISEEVPAGIVDHAVICLKSIPSNDPMLGPALGVIAPPVVGATITLDLADRETVECDWYNVPAPGFDDDPPDGGGDLPDDGDVPDDGGDLPDGGGDTDEESDPGLIVQLPNTGAGTAVTGGRLDPTWSALALLVAVLSLARARYQLACRPAPARGVRR